MKRCHITISGMVQGVFYRSFAKENASILGITGWVRNLPNNKVEIVAEGKERDINEFLMRLRKGSPASSVTDIAVEWSNTKKKFSSFDII